MAGSRTGQTPRGVAKRLVCVVEGRGEVEAIPCLCSRIRDYLNAWEWIVDPQPVRQPRSLLVDERVPSPNRPPRTEGFSRAVELAIRRPATAVLVICDSDDDCPASWGPAARQLVSTKTAGGAVMAVREYEVWLLTSLLKADNWEGRKLEEIRDAKGRLGKVAGAYTPSVHQRKLTQNIDLDVVWAHSESFDTLIRTLARIFGVACPPRPTAGQR